MFAIIPEDIVLPSSILDTIIGKYGVYIENPWFTPKITGKYQYNKDLGKTKNFAKQKGNSGIVFGTPRLYLKNPKTNEFSSNFCIKFVGRNNQRKVFYVRKPYLSTGDLSEFSNSDKFKEKITMSPTLTDKNGAIGQPEDEIIIRLDQIVTQTVEFVMAALFCKFTVDESISSDKELIAKFCEHLKQPDAINFLSEKYYEFMKNPPVWEKDNGIYKIVSYPDDSDNQIYTLFELIRKISKMKSEGKVNKLTQFDQEILKKFLLKENAVMTPTLKRYIFAYTDQYRIKNPDAPEFGTAIDYELRFQIKSDKTPLKFPEYLITKYPHKNNPKNFMTREDLVKYCYGTNLTNLRGNIGRDQIIMIAPINEIGLYRMGQPKIEWRIDVIRYHNVVNEISGNNDYINEMVNNDLSDDENTEAVFVRPTLMKQNEFDNELLNDDSDDE